MKFNENNFKIEPLSSAKSALAFTVEHAYSQSFIKNEGGIFLGLYFKDFLKLISLELYLVKGLLNFKKLSSSFKCEAQNLWQLKIIFMEDSNDYQAVSFKLNNHHLIQKLDSKQIIVLDEFDSLIPSFFELAIEPDPACLYYFLPQSNLDHLLERFLDFTFKQEKGLAQKQASDLISLIKKSNFWQKGLRLYAGFNFSN